MKRLYSLLLCLALAGQACWAEDLLDNADLAPGNDLGEPVIIRPVSYTHLTLPTN